MRAQLTSRLPALLGILLIAATTSLDTRAQSTVTVLGEGIVRVLPDQATVMFGVVTHHENPEEARAANAAAARDAMNEIRRLGVAERDLRLENLRLQPWREYNPDTRNYEQRGFEAVRDVRVVVRDLDALPELIARIVQNGANRLNGINYDLEDREAVKREALERAAGNAREKAALLTRSLGVTLSVPVSIAEEGVQIPTPSVRLEAMAMARSADAAPEPDAYAAGEIEVSARVTVTFVFRHGQD